MQMLEIKRNRKAFFDYEHLETFDAGMVLTGAEAKSIKGGLINLDGSYITIRNGEAWLIGAHIAAYPKAGSNAGYKPDRARKLLMKKKEIAGLSDATSASGLTVVPLFVYSSHRLIKMRLALARGKRKFDKREKIKKREYQRRLNARFKGMS